MSGEGPTGQANENVSIRNLGTSEQMVLEGFVKEMRRIREFKNSEDSTTQYENLLEKIRSWSQGFDEDVAPIWYTERDGDEIEEMKKSKIRVERNERRNEALQERKKKEREETALARRRALKENGIKDFE